jgi:hypothetical protein
MQSPLSCSFLDSPLAIYTSGKWYREPSCQNTVVQVASKAILPEYCQESGQLWEGAAHQRHSTRPYDVVAHTSWSLQGITLVAPLVRKLGPMANPANLPKLPLESAAVWAFYGAYIGYVMLGTGAPGQPVWQVSPETLAEVSCDAQLSFIVFHYELQQDSDGSCWFYAGPFVRVRQWHSSRQQLDTAIQWKKLGLACIVWHVSGNALQPPHVRAERESVVELSAPLPAPAGVP